MRGAAKLRSYTIASVVLLSSFVFPQSQEEATVPADSVRTSKAPGKTPAISFDPTGLLFSTRDGANILRAHGYIQADDRLFFSSLRGQDFDVFLFRRIRPIFEGTVFGAIDFRFMPDFGQYNPQIQEAYVEWKTFPLAKLRIGKFKEPIGLEVDRSDRDLTFPERSLVSDLLPLRYMGLQLGGSALSNSVSYAVGYFNGSNDGTNGSFQWIPANEIAGRLFLLPFARSGLHSIRNLGVGIGASLANQHGTIAELRTVGQSTFFKYSAGTLANGRHTRISPQAYYFAGSIGILGEYAVSTQDVAGNGKTQELRNRGWQLSASVVLTGEKNTYGGVRPRRNFDPARGIRHLGAFEVAVRYAQLAIDRDAFPLFASPNTAAQQARERAVGLNWYLNAYLKLTADYEHTAFKMAAAQVVPLPGEDLLVSRVQLAF